MPLKKRGQGKLVRSRTFNSCADLRILLVEDDESSQRLTLHILMKIGMRVDVAVNGHEALLAILRNTYDVILMDVTLPGLSGLEVTRMIREQKVGLHVWIVALTACAMKEDRKRCLEAGMDAYISKPFVGQELIDLLQKLCSLSKII
ncbi:MAG: response regulator [Rhodothermales bacterium]